MVLIVTTIGDEHVFGTVTNKTSSHMLAIHVLAACLVSALQLNHHTCIFNIPDDGYCLFLCLILRR